jgi:hypothetical protein
MRTGPGTGDRRKDSKKEKWHEWNAAKQRSK